MKRCTKCGVTKPLDHFYSDVRASDGKRSSCKPCFMAGIKRWKQTPEIKALNSERAKAKYAANRAKMLAASIARRNADPEKVKKMNDAHFKSLKGRSTVLWHKAKTRHKGSVETLVSRDYILKKLKDGVCERTGIPFAFDKHEKYARHMYSPSVDKVDPAGDYTEDNVKIVCCIYNFGKNSYTHDEFLDFCRAFVAHADGANHT